MPIFLFLSLKQVTGSVCAGLCGGDGVGQLHPLPGSGKRLATALISKPNQLNYLKLQYGP